MAQHLRAWCDYSQGGHAISYWQTRSQVEVDFVIYGESALYAIKVKNTQKVRSEDLSALKSFAEDYPESQKILLHRGRKRCYEMELSACPVKNFSVL